MTILRKTGFMCSLAAMLATPVSLEAAPAGVQISEVTSNYSISGKTASEFAKSMSRRGPYSRQHRRRAWATAARNVVYQIDSRQTGKGCRVVGARVKMKITYTLPALRSTRGVSALQQKKWRQMASLLQRHERQHGAYYKQFARQVHKSLLKMGPAQTCSQLERNAKTMVEKLSEQDRQRNNRFDQRDGRNYRRMARIYSGS